MYVQRECECVFKTRECFCFYDTGRRGWTGEWCPAVALFSGLADASSEWCDGQKFSVCVYNCVKRVSLAIFHSVLDFFFLLLETSIQSLQKISCESFNSVVLFKSWTEKRLWISASVQLKTFYFKSFTCMKRLFGPYSVVTTYQRIQTSHFPCKPGSKYPSSFSTCQGGLHW